MSEEKDRLNRGVLVIGKKKKKRRIMLMLCIEGRLCEKVDLSNNGALEWWIN